MSMSGSINNVIEKLNGLIDCEELEEEKYNEKYKKNYEKKLDSLMKELMKEMKEILNEFICIYNENNKYVRILDEDADIDSLNGIRKECSNSKDINDYIDIFEDIFKNLEQFREINNLIIEYNKSLSKLKDIKLDSEFSVKKIENYLKDSISLGQQPDNYDKLESLIKDYSSTLEEYNDIVDPKSSLEKKPNKDIETMIEFKDYCDKITKDSSFDLFLIKKKLGQMKESVQNDKLSEKQKNIMKPITNPDTKTDPDTDIDKLSEFKKNTNPPEKYQDLAYKVRKIIKNWMSCFDELMGMSKISISEISKKSKELEELKKLKEPNDPKELKELKKKLEDLTKDIEKLAEYSLDNKKADKYKMFLLYLQALDDNTIQYQNKNKSKKAQRFKPGFYTSKHKILYAEKKDKDKNEIKEKIIKSTNEKKMWNVKMNGKKLKKGIRYEYIGDEKHGYKKINVALSNFEPYFSVDDVKQGDTGDCWLEATLKSMALKSPDKLLELFPNYLKEVSHIDGSLLGNQITVKLYDYKDNSEGGIITFSPEKIKEITVHATEINWNEGKVLWPSAIEKAIDKLIEKFHHDESYNYGQHIDGGNGAQAHVILTGESSSLNKVDEKNPRKTLYTLNEALKKSYAPTCGTKSGFGTKVKGQREEEQRLDHSNAKEVRFLFSGHVYTLKAVREDENNILETKIDLINPWGEKKSDEKKVKDRNKYNKNQYKHYENAVGKDKITITLSEFMKYFIDIYY